MKITNELINEWIKLYNKPTSTLEISKIYNVSMTTVIKYLRNNNVEIRPIGVVLKVKNKKNYDENYFENIDTEKKAYFLGLLYADGNVSNNNRVSISLKKNDKHILEEMKHDMNGEMNIFDDKKNNRVLYFSGKKIVKDLEKYGLIPRKSLIIKYPDLDKNLNRHFIRGYFDGDGNIYKRKTSNSSRFSICSGSKSFLDEIKYILIEDLNIKNCKNSKIKNTKCNIIAWSQVGEIKKIYKYLYNKSNIFLLRKKSYFDKSILSMDNIKRKSFNYWTKEKCQKEALKYKKITYFKKSVGGAYNSAYCNGWLNDICKHMKNTKNLC